MNYLKYTIVALIYCLVTCPSGAQVITTIAGPGNKIHLKKDKVDILPTITNANGVAVDNDGNVYVAEYWESGELQGSIFKFNPSDTFNKHESTLKRGETIPPPPGYIPYPHGIAIDAAGNMYVAGYSSHIVLKITPGGMVSTVAGCGEAGYTGDHGSATAATLSLLNGIAVDKLGNLYIADEFNNAIRKVTAAGIISTLAGNGIPGYHVDGGPAARALLNRPYGIAVDDTGNIYFSDAYNNVIRKISPDGTISTIAGNSQAGYSGDGGPARLAELNKPAGLAVDDFGMVYVADEDNNVVRKIDATGIITTVAGNGTKGYTGDGFPATDATLSDPRDVAIDHNGNIYIADFGNHVVRRLRVSIPFPATPFARLPAVPLSVAVVTKPAMAIQPAPGITTPASTDKLPLLAGVSIPVYPPQIPIPQQVSIPVIEMPASKIPVSAPIFFSVVPQYVVVSAIPVSIPSITLITTAVKIPLMPVVLLPAAVTLPQRMLNLIDIPDIAVTRSPDTPSPSPPIEDKVTISISQDNIMTIISDQHTYTSFAITKMTGEKIFEKPITSAKTEVDVTILHPGNYYISLKGSKEIKTLRFVKEN